jgi:hypothetical protein
LRSLSCGFADVKTGLELVEDCLGKALGHDARILQVCWHMKNTKLTKHHQFTNEMYVDLDMFCSPMMNRVTGEVDDRHIVTVEDNGFVNIDMELLKKVLQPVTLNRGICDTTVFCSAA